MQKIQPTKRFIKHANVSPVIASVVTSKLATLHELQTVYGMQDMWDLLEINTVANKNEAIASEV